ncbi:hypothetical protein WA577_000794 [Blastocystis sp. JDR]
MSVTESTRETGLDLVKNDLLYTFDGVECMVNQAQSHSAGTLYLTKDNLVFVAPEGEDYSLAIEYPAIGVHAVCQEDTLWKRPCIYCQICDPQAEDSGEVNVICGDPSFDAFDQGEEVEEEEEEEDDGSIFEVLFSPLETEKIDSVFDGISRLQVMHPDPVKEEEEDNMFMTANGLVSVEDHICSLFEKAAAEYEGKDQE